MKTLKVKMLLITFTALLILFGSTTSYVQATSKEFSATDYETDKTYIITPTESGTSISSDSFYILLPMSTPVLSCCVNKGVVHILTYADNDDSHCAAYYSVDTSNCDFSYTIIPELPIAADEIRFSVDAENNFYLIDRYNNRIVNRYRNGVITSFDLNATVNQILCPNGYAAVILTEKGIFNINNTGALMVSSVIPQPPCVYIGNGIITDAEGTRYTYENGCLIPYEVETTACETTTPNVNSNTSIVIKDSCIIVPQGLTFAKLYKGLGLSKSDLTVYKTNGSVLSQGTLGTGMTASFDGKNYNVVIYGELTGEGNINSRDLKLLMEHLTGEVKLSSVQRLSADINKDGNICTKDLLLLSRMY